MMNKKSKQVQLPSGPRRGLHQQDSQTPGCRCLMGETRHTTAYVGDHRGHAYTCPSARW